MNVLIKLGCFRSTLRILTSFTAAHSIMLALATPGLVALPTRVVEPSIALSIVYVELEKIFRRDLERRWMLTFAFGLARGFGLVLPLVWQLRRHPSFVARWVPSCSVRVAAAGGFWLIERVLL